MNCANCIKLRAEAGKTPACETKTGCEIGDIAPDFDLNRIVDDFLLFKRLGIEGGGYVHSQTVLLERSGLIDEPDLLVEMEQIYQTALDNRRKRNELKDKTKVKSGGLRRRH